ncbi:RhuM family protein, partial [Providencia stuartii]
IEGIIERRNTFTMEAFAESVNKFLAFNEYQVLEGYGSVSRKVAEQKAHAEYEQFNKQQKIESDFDREIKKLLNDGRKKKD